MRIEEGKYYRAANGEKIGPMEVGDTSGWPWEINGGEYDPAIGTRWAWREDGSFTDDDHGLHPEFSLVAEWTEDGPVRTVTRQEIIPGTYDEVEVGSEVTGHPQREVMVRIAIDHGPMVCMDADQLERAAAVLTALAGALRDEQ